MASTFNIMLRGCMYSIPILLIFSCQSPGKSEQETYNKPNIILLMGDDHGFEETGYNGHPFVKTPVLDEMAAKGLRLDRFYSGHPSCSPTRGGIITGRHPNRYGTYTPNWSMRPEEISIGQLMKAAGYSTGHFGKWHLGPVKKESPTSPGAMGFDTWLSHDNFFELDPVLSRNGEPPVQIKGEGSEVIIDETISFIQKAGDKNNPFFAIVWFGSPHEPYQALPEDLALYEDLPDSLSQEFVRLTSLVTGEATSRPLDSVLQERFAEITAMDRAIGKLRNFLMENQLAENTLLWYCGDNGIPSSGLWNSKFHGLKGTIYEGGTRVPGIIEWPNGIATPFASAVNSVSTDMLPTLVDLVGGTLPDRPIDGISLIPLIKGEMQERPEPIGFWMFDTRHLTDEDPYIDPKLQEGTTPLAKQMDGVFTRSFRNFHHREITSDDYKGDRSYLDNTYKLIIREEGGAEIKELYDIREDPGETENIIEKYPEIADDLDEQLKNWQKSVLNSLTGADYQ
ncbi:MAG: sulfatase [Bacteroidota bacterium]